MVSETAILKYEARQIAHLRKWRDRRPGRISRAFDFVTSPVAWAFHEVIPKGAVEATLRGNLRFAKGWAHERGTLKVLKARSFDEIAEAALKHRNRAAKKIQKRAVYLAAGIGFAAGVFGFLSMPIGMAAALNLALRTIHRVSLCYGYREPGEREQLFVYYTLSLAGARHPAERQALLEALAVLSTLAPDPAHETIRQEAITVNHHDFSREITKQLIQVRLLTAIPGVGAFVGMIVDARYMRSVGTAARHAYQRRWLADRGRWPEEMADLESIH